MPSLAAHTLLIAIVAVSILLMLLRPRNIPEVYWVVAGALLLVLTRLIPLSLAGHAMAEGTDVYLFLAGMMLLSELARENGVFDWIASVAVTHARSSATRLFAVLYLSGVAVTVCLSNDATAIVLTPAVLASVRRARINPLPFLFACAMIANAASFVLPISNPANLVVFHNGMPPLTRWLISFLAPSLASILVTYVVLRLYFRHELTSTLQPDHEDTRLNGHGKLVLLGVAIIVIVLLLASSFGKDLGLPTFLSALIITTIVLIRTHSSPIPLLKQISWSTLLLVAALFILVEAVQSIGALAFTEHALLAAQRLAAPIAAATVGFTVAIANNLINNLPAGLIAANTITLTHTQGLLRDVTLIAVDLGPNLSVTGSLATILWLLALRREGLNVTVLDFLKAGLFAMPLALIAALAASLSINLLAAH
ncbi:MAG TPA: SLC13 family permease [Acidobacteriaceae bacterium]|nr:SLC13 family permease [Acidobacteriaceae bacterium]